MHSLSIGFPLNEREEASIGLLHLGSATLVADKLLLILELIFCKIVYLCENIVCAASALSLGHQAWLTCHILGP